MTMLPPLPLPPPLLLAFEKFPSAESPPLLVIRPAASGPRGDPRPYSELDAVRRRGLLLPLPPLLLLPPA